MSKISRWLEGMLGIAALIGLAVLLTVLFSRAAKPGRTPAQSGASTSPVGTQIPPIDSTISPWPPQWQTRQAFESTILTPPFPTPMQMPTRTPPPVPTPLPTPVVTPIPVAKAPFIPGIEGKATQPYQIVFRRENTLWVMNNDGSDRRILLDAVSRAGLYLRIIPWVSAEWPGRWDVSPDGTQLAFTAFNSEKLEHADQEYTASIYLLDVATGDLRFLVFGGVLAWSPDGKQIACIREYNLWVVDATTGQGKKILDIERGYAAENVAWAPDRDRIAVQYKVASEGGTPELLVIGIGESESVPQVIIPRTWWGMWGAAWLPDRKSILYIFPEREPTEQVFDNLWVVDTETHVSTQLTARVNVSYFALSPLTDGWVAFIGLPTYEGAPGLPYDLWLLDTKSGRLLRLGKNANRDGIYDPRWSPDGTQIVFQMFGQGIWTLGLADGNLRQVYPGEPKVYHYDMAILGRAQ